MRTETGRGRRPGWEPKLVCPDGWSLQVWGGDGPSRELEEKEAGAAEKGRESPVPASRRRSLQEQRRRRLKEVSGRLGSILEGKSLW